MNARAGFFIFALLCISVYADEAASSDVVVLTDSTLEQIKTGVWLVEFYAPWCGHCKKLVPTWDQLATAVKGKFNVAKVDCTVEKEAGKTYEIRGFPTIKLFKDGEVVAYSGARTVEAFVKFVEDNVSQLKGLSDSLPGSLNSAPATPAPEAAKPAPAAEKKEEGGAPSDVTVLTTANFEELTKDGAWLIEFYAPWCGHCQRLVPVWEQLATAQKGKFHVAKVDCTVEKDLATKYGVRGFPTIKLLNNGVVTDFNGQRTVESFAQFVENNVNAKTEL